MQKFIIISIFICFFSSCSEDEKKHKPLAKVGEKYLYLEDIENVIPEKIMEDDSIDFVKNYVKKWIKKQLLIAKAELNLTNDEKNVSELLVNYRSSLIVFKYEQKLLSQKLDTFVNEEEIELYYDDHSNEFTLEKNIIFPFYLKVPKNAPNISSVKKWYKEYGLEHWEELKDYCFKYAETHTLYSDDWIFFDDLLSVVPKKIKNQEHFLENYSTIETKDKDFFYFVKINDFLLKGDNKPLFQVKQEVKTIILNKRKINFINSLENNIFEEAVRNNDFTTFE